MHKCVICKTGKGTKGLSFHKFPKDAKTLQLWIKSIGKKDFTPTANSFVCSQHFAPECLEPAFTRVSLRKGSIPSILNDGEASIAQGAASEKSIDTETESKRPQIVAVSMNSINSVAENKITIKQEPERVQMVTASHSSVSSNAKNKNIAMQRKLERTPVIIKGTLPAVTLSAESVASTIESSKTHNAERSPTSSRNTSPCVEFKQLVRHDHIYTHTPTSYKKKLDSMSKSLRDVRNMNRVLKQKVKRLQLTVCSLKEVIKAMNGCKSIKCRIDGL